jgi:hypothetical protein
MAGPEAGDPSPADLPEGVRVWREDGGWYVAVGEVRQGPFLYRPALLSAWEREPPTPGGGERLVERFVRFDAAGEQVTLRSDYRLGPGGERALLRTVPLEAPPSPEAYEGLEHPGPTRP